MNIINIVVVRKLYIDNNILPNFINNKVLTTMLALNWMSTSLTLEVGGVQ